MEVVGLGGCSSTANRAVDDPCMRGIGRELVERLDGESNDSCEADNGGKVSAKGCGKLCNGSGLVEEAKGEDWEGVVVVVRGGLWFCGDPLEVSCFPAWAWVSSDSPAAEGITTCASSVFAKAFSKMFRTSRPSARSSRESSNWSRMSPSGPSL